MFATLPGYECVILIATATFFATENPFFEAFCQAGGKRPQSAALPISKSVISKAIATFFATKNYSHQCSDQLHNFCYSSRL